jgi:hypothetical protein
MTVSRNLVVVALVLMFASVSFADGVNTVSVNGTCALGNCASPGVLLLRFAALPRRCALVVAGAYRDCSYHRYFCPGTDILAST